MPDYDPDRPSTNRDVFPPLPAHIPDIPNDTWLGPFYCIGEGSYIQAVNDVVHVRTGYGEIADDDEGVRLLPGAEPLLFLGLTLVRFRSGNDWSNRNTKVQIVSASRYDP